MIWEQNPIDQAVTCSYALIVLSVRDYQVINQALVADLNQLHSKIIAISVEFIHLARNDI